MALTESTEEDRIEVVGTYKAIQVRTATIIKRDGTEISRTFHRKTLQCTDDLDNESDQVKGIAGVVWTDDLKTSYQEYVDTQSENPPGG
tara:strand:+ start:878 stop:1144 length:267 start_codon:yes stop_codon:yes gene_type:complete